VNVGLPLHVLLVLLAAHCGDVFAVECELVAVGLLSVQLRKERREEGGHRRRHRRRREVGGRGGGGGGGGGADLAHDQAPRLYVRSPAAVRDADSAHRARHDVV
jgi:hypothetical protein